MHKPLYRFSVLITITYLIALVLIVFWPTPVDRPISGVLSQAIEWLHRRGMPQFIGYNKIEFAANIALFVPLGFIAATKLKRAWSPILLSAVSSLCIEFGQALWLPNRVPSAIDVLANTVGGTIGVAVLLLERKLRTKKTGSPELATPPSRISPRLVEHVVAGPAADKITTQLPVATDEMTRPRRKHGHRNAETASKQSTSNKRWQVSHFLHSRIGKATALLMAAIIGAASQAAFSAMATPTPPGAEPKSPISTPSPSQSKPPATPPKPVVAVIGDDYAVGVGASTRGAGWTEVLAREKGWDIRNLAHKSTGYVSALSGEPALATCDREACPNYGHLVDRLKSIQPSIVIVSGGRNDVSQEAAKTAAEIDSFYRQLTAALPQAKIIATTPVWDATPAPGELTRISQQVKTSATAAGAKVIDLGQPLQGRPDRVVGSGRFPNDTGHVAIANSIIAALKPQEHTRPSTPPVQLSPSTIPTSSAAPTPQVDPANSTLTGSSLVATTTNTPSLITPSSTAP